MQNMNAVNPLINRHLGDRLYMFIPPTTGEMMACSSVDDNNLGSFITRDELQKPASWYE